MCHKRQAERRKRSHKGMSIKGTNSRGGTVSAIKMQTSAMTYEEGHSVKKVSRGSITLSTTRAIG